MKHFMNFNKRKVALSLMAALAWGGVSSVSAETLTTDFNSGLPEGWSLVGDLTNDDTRARGNSGKGVWTSSKSDNANYIVTEEIEGTLSFYWRSYNSSRTNGYIFIYEYDGSSVGSKIAETGAYLSSTWKSQTISLNGYSGQVAIALNAAAIDDVTYTQKEVADGPALIVKDGSKVTSPYAFDFGLATAGTTKTFTLSNPGTEAVEGLAVSANDFNATLSATTIAAGGEATLTITMPETTASNTITLSSTTAGIEPFVFNISGTVKDPNKMFEDFSDKALPDGWDAQGNSYTWNFTNGYAGYSGYNATYSGSLTTKKLSFTAGEKFFFDAKINATYSASSASITVQTSEDGIEFTDLETIGSAQMSTSAWNSFSVTIPSANVKYIRFANCIYAAIDNVYGGNLPLEPKMKFEASDYSFGMISADATTAAYTIQNTGLAELTGVTVVSSNAQFIVSDVPATIAANGQATFTVTMKSDVKGLQEGKITVSADGFDAVEFNVSGYVLDNDVIVVDFAGNTVPEGWTNNGFTVSNNELSTTYNTRTLTSPAITVADGQKLIVYAKGNSTFYASLTVKTSTDNGNTFTTAKEFTTEIRNNTTDYEVLVVDNIPAGNYILQFEGYQVTINTINGYTYNMNAPVMDFTAEDFAAGVVTENASKTYTVANSGTGELTVNIASDNEQFTVSPAQLVITDEAKEFTVTFNHAEGVYGKFEANITVTPTYDETAAVSFKATAQVKNPNVWSEDFEAGTLPTGWVANNWTVGSFSSYENQTKMALAPQSSTAGTLITPCLSAKDGDVLSWDAYLNWYDEALIVEYSNDNQATWTQIYNYKTQDDTEAPSTTQRNYHKAMSFTAPAEGNYYLRFTSTYQNGVDNFEGFKLVVKEHDAIIATQNIPATGTQYLDYTATVTVKEMAGKDESNVVATLYVDGADVATDTQELTANGDATFTLTFTPDAAIDAKKAYIKVSYEDVELTTEEVDLTIAAAPVISETAEENPFEAKTYEVMVLDYKAKKGWNTIALPFTLTDLSVFGTDVKAFEFDSFTDGVLSFKKVEKISNQTPALLYVGGEPATEPIVLKNIQVMSASASLCGTTKGEATFQGVYAKTAAGDLTDKYGVSTQGVIGKISATGTLKAMRAYFDITVAEGTRLSLSIDGGMSTDIDGIFTEGQNENVYNLQGQKVMNAQKGLYIVNGKKVVRK